ncbi:hypothetical protein Tco_0449094 [Tanacetum coccineum]
MPKSHTRNHRILPSTSVNARRAAYHNRKLNVVDHNQFVIRSLKSVNTKTPQAKHSVNHTKKRIASIRKSDTSVLEDLKALSWKTCQEGIDIAKISQERAKTGQNGHEKKSAQDPGIYQSYDISITSPKIDFLPEEFAGELDLIYPILPGIDEDDFDEEEGEIDIDIFQIVDEILCQKLLNVNLLIDKIEALNLTPSIPFVLEYPSTSPISVVDSDFLIKEVDTFLVPEDSIPPGIESDFDSEGDIIFSNDLLNDDHIP